MDAGEIGIEERISMTRIEYSCLKMKIEYDMCG